MYTINTCLNIHIYKVIVFTTPDLLQKIAFMKIKINTGVVIVASVRLRVAFNRFLNKLGE